MCFWSSSHKFPCAYCVDIVSHALNIGVSLVAYTLINSPRRLVYLADCLFWANKTLNSKQQIAKLICGLSKYFFTFVQVSQDYFMRDYGFSSFSLKIFPPTHFRRLILLLAGARGGTSARTYVCPRPHAQGHQTLCGCCTITPPAKPHKVFFRLTYTPVRHPRSLRSTAQTCVPNPHHLLRSECRPHLGPVQVFLSSPVFPSLNLKDVVRFSSGLIPNIIIPVERHFLLERLFFLHVLGLLWACIKYP